MLMILVSHLVRIWTRDPSKLESKPRDNTKTDNKINIELVIFHELKLATLCYPCLLL